LGSLTEKGINKPMSVGGIMLKIIGKGCCHKPVLFVKLIKGHK